MIVGIVGAAMTAAYMTRCVWLTFFGEFRGHGHPHESPRSDHRPPRHPDRAWRSAPAGSTPSGSTASPSGPSNDVVTAAMQSAHATEAKFNWPVALISIGVAVIAIAVTFAYYEFHAFGAAHELTRKSRLARAGYELPGEQVLPRRASTPTTSSAPSRARSPGPATGSTRTSSTQWSTVSPSGTRYTAGFVYRVHRPGRDRRRGQRGRGRGRGERLASSALFQTGRVQQYAAAFFFFGVVVISVGLLALTHAFG